MDAPHSAHPDGVTGFAVRDEAINGIPHPEQLPPAPLTDFFEPRQAPPQDAAPGPAAASVATPSSVAPPVQDEGRLSPEPSSLAPPAGIEALATKEPLTAPDRQLEEPVAASLHFGGEQAATAAGDARLDDPVATSGEGIPAFNADVEMVVDEEPAPAVESAPVPIQDGQLQQQDGTSVPAHSGEGLLPSAPPLFPGLDDGDEVDSPADAPIDYATSAPSASAAELSTAASPSAALKRPLSPASVDDPPESAKRAKLASPAVTPAQPSVLAPPSPLPTPSVPSPQPPAPSADHDVPMESLEVESTPVPVAASVVAPPVTSGLDTPASASPVPPPAPIAAVESPAPAAAEPALPPPAPLAVESTPVPATPSVPVTPSVPTTTAEVEAPAPAPVAGPSTAAAEPEDIKPEPWPARIMPGTPGTRLSKDQHRYLRSVMTQLKKHRCQGPFSVPVDPIALNIPHYPQYVKRPMDLRTVEEKLGKMDKATGGSVYHHVDDFIADIRLIFNNCYIFNGTEAPISKMAQELSAHFDNLLKKLPPDEPPFVAPPPPTPAPPPPPKKSASPVVARSTPPEMKKKERRPSVSVNGAPTIRRNSSDGQNRPKREIKAPEKELPYFAEQAEKEAARPKQHHHVARRHSTLPSMIPNTAAELKFCKEVIKELFSKKNYAFAWPFLQPVDPVAMGLHDYNRIIKKPMDLGTVKTKLDRGEYKNGAAFAADVRLMLNNCFTYNPQGQDVYQMGKQVEKVFENRWFDRPPEKIVAPQPDESDGEPDVAPETLALRDQIAKMQAQLQQLEKQAKQPTKSSKAIPGSANSKSKSKSKSGMNGSSRPSKPKTSIGSAGAPRPRKQTSYRDDDYDFDGSDGDFDVGDDDFDVISYDQKKELATKIQEAQEPMQSNAIQLIRDSRPDLVSADGEEIELDIDALDDRTLYKLWRLVCAPSGRKKAKAKKNRDGRLTASGSVAKKSGRAGTGGPKRQGLDEGQEAAKIAELQNQLQAYDQPGGGGVGPLPKPSAAPEYASSSSDSDSDSDSD